MNEQHSVEDRRLFDVQSAAAYLKSLGATAASVCFIRGLIASGELPRVKISKAFYVSRQALDRWLETRERRSRG